MKALFQRLYSKGLVYVLRIGGLCSACFLIEACYGAPQGQFDGTKMVNFNGKIKSETNINNTEVIITNNLTSDTIRANCKNDGTYQVSSEVTPLASYTIAILSKDKKQAINPIKLTKEQFISNRVKQDLNL